MRSPEGYRFQSSLPSDIASSSSYRDSSQTAATSSNRTRTYITPKSTQHRRKHSRELPPAHPFAAANQRNRYSASPSSRSTLAPASRVSHISEVAVDSPSSGHWNYGGPDDRDAATETDAESIRGAPPSVRLSMKSTFTIRSVIDGGNRDFFPWHLRRESAAGASGPAGEQWGNEGTGPSSWARRVGTGEGSGGRSSRSTSRGRAAPRRKSVAVAPISVGRDEAGPGQEVRTDEEDDDDELGGLPVMLYTARD